MHDEVKVDRCRADGVPILRRTSGGGSVVVGPGILCVSVFLEEAAAPELSAVDLAQRYVLESIASAIRSVGPAVDLQGRGDLALAGRKCGGSAQRRLKLWLMVHCSILYDFDIETIERYLAMPRRQPDYRAGRAHRDFLVSLGMTAQSLKAAIRQGCTTGECASAHFDFPHDLAAALRSEKFANPRWIERIQG